MADGRLHLQRQAQQQNDPSQHRSATNPSGKQDEDIRGFLVFDHVGKVVDAQQRRSHAAQVGHRRASNASLDSLHPSVSRVSHPASKYTN